MKRLFLAVFMAAFVMASYAVPAKRGVVKTLKLVDGTEVTAQLVGDETMHYFVTDDGKKYVAGEDGLYREADMTLLNSRAAQRRSKMNAVIRQQAPKRVGGVGNVFCKRLFQGSEQWNVRARLRRSGSCYAYENLFLLRSEQLVWRCSSR